MAKDVLSMDRQGYHERDHDNHVDGGDGDEDSVDHGVNSIQSWPPYFRGMIGTDVGLLADRSMVGRDDDNGCNGLISLSRDSRLPLCVGNTNSSSSLRLPLSLTTRRAAAPARSRSNRPYSQARNSTIFNMTCVEAMSPAQALSKWPAAIW